MWCWEEEACGESSGVRVEECDVFGCNVGSGGGWNDVGSGEALDATIGEDTDETGKIVCYLWFWGGGWCCVCVVVHGSDEDGDR